MKWSKRIAFVGVAILVVAITLPIPCRCWVPVVEKPQPENPNIIHCQSPGLKMDMGNGDWYYAGPNIRLRSDGKHFERQNLAQDTRSLATDVFNQAWWYFEPFGPGIGMAGGGRAIQ